MCTTPITRRHWQGFEARRQKGLGYAKTAVFPVGVQPSGVQEYERKQLLERIGREGATVGARIPDEIDVQDERVELRDFVFEIKRRETVPQGERDRVERAKRNLRKERLERLESIEEGEISREEGERLAESIIGIDRALEGLQNLGPADVEAEAQAQAVADKKRWTRFMRQALGLDEDSTPNRR